MMNDPLDAGKENPLDEKLSDGLIKLDPVLEAINKTIAPNMWEVIVPLMYERSLREDYPNKPPFLGSGVVYENLLRDNFKKGVTIYGGKPNIKPPDHRDPRWEKVSQEWLANKVCVICGGKFRLVAHHIKPFHDFPELEMVESNWTPLCEGRVSANCHITWGHYGNWTLWNPKVLEMCVAYHFGFTQARLPRS